MSLVSLALLGSSLGCALGPIYARRVEGVVLDKRTGEGVAGAEVFVVYEIVQGSHRRAADTRWATTDAEGRFAIPGVFSMTLGPPPSVTDRNYFVRVVHPDYGKFSSVANRRVETWPHHRFVFEIEPNSQRGLFESPRHWASLCRGLNSKGCDRMCEYAYGSAEACYERGRLRRE